MHTDLDLHKEALSFPLCSLALYAACACLRMCVHVYVHACVHACVHVRVLNALRPLHYEHATRNDVTGTLLFSLHHGRDYIEAPVVQTFNDSKVLRIGSPWPAIPWANAGKGKSFRNLRLFIGHESCFVQANANYSIK